MSLDVIRAWVTEALDVPSWPILMSITAPAGSEAVEPTQAAPTPDATQSKLAMATLSRLRVASLDRLVREVARLDRHSTRSSVLQELEHAQDRVQWFGAALVCVRGES